MRGGGGGGDGRQGSAPGRGRQPTPAGPLAHPAGNRARPDRREAVAAVLALSSADTARNYPGEFLSQLGN